MLAVLYRNDRLDAVVLRAQYPDDMTLTEADDRALWERELGPFVFIFYEAMPPISAPQNIGIATHSGRWRLTVPSRLMRIHVSLER